MYGIDIAEKSFNVVKSTKTYTNITLMIKLKIIHFKDRKIIRQYTIPTSNQQCTQHQSGQKRHNNKKVTVHK